MAEKWAKSHGGSHYKLIFIPYGYMSNHHGDEAVKLLPHPLLADLDQWTGANCLRPGAKPTDWDIDSFEPVKGKQRRQKRIRAVKQCDGCPVLVSCAKAAAAERLPGTVRAGILLTNVHGSMGRATLGYLDRLAAGEAPAPVWREYTRGAD